MHISQFRVQNFKSFRDVTFHFDEKLNLLTAENNGGKTTVLEALALWHECYQLLLQQVNTENLSNHKDKNLGTFVFSALNGKAELFINNRNIISIRSNDPKDIFHYNDANETIYLNATLKNEGKTIEICFSIKLFLEEMYILALQNNETFDYELFNSEDFIGSIEKGIDVVYASPLATLLSSEEVFREEKIKQFVKMRNSREVLRNRLRLLKTRNESAYFDLLAALSLILEDNLNRVDIRIIEEQLGLGVKTMIKMDGQPYIDLLLMGSGTLQIIEILLAIFSEQNDLKILLLDEPDSHIHRKLQRRLLNVLGKVKSTQIFMTTHNEALIRDVQEKSVFHLENETVKIYDPIAKNLPTKKGLLQSGKSPVIAALSGGNSLDFVNALEADVLFLVEGEDDALRIQQILGLRSNDSTKYAFWLMRGVENIFGQIGLYKDIFTQIRNRKTLWEKAILIFDKDYMTEKHRSELVHLFTEKLKIKTHSWQSYNFEAVLFADIPKLARFLFLYIRYKTGDSTDTTVLETDLVNNLNDIILLKKEKIKCGHLFQEIVGNLQARRAKLEMKELKLEFKKVIEDDTYLKTELEKYWLSCCNDFDFHKIMDKREMQAVLTATVAPYGLRFIVDDTMPMSDFNDLFSFISYTNLPTEYAQIFNLLR